MLKSRFTTSFYFTLALAYTGLIFYIAPRLPLWTKKWAAALTWVVYAQVVKSLMIFFAVVLLFVMFIKWFSLSHKWRFLGLMAVYLGITAYFLHLLGNSVNEYIHFPEYAACVLVWYAAFNNLERSRQGTGAGPKGNPAILLITGTPLRKAVSVGLFLGVLEELYQAYLPQRVYDFHDILLNFMGVWLGGMLVWIFRQKKDPGSDRAPISGYG